MAALPKPDPRPDTRGQASGERLRLLRELGTQAVPAWAALESRAGAAMRLVVVERAARKAFEDGEIADWIRDARRLSALDHPNVARVRDVLIRSGDILVVSEFVDGVRWREFAATATLETALRVFVDALTGLSALHNLRDATDPKRQHFKLVHGGLTPDCIVVGLDGIARVVGASRPRSATARLAGTGSAYLAPEVLLEDDSADARADVYSVGVMLWEALSQRAFLPNLQPSAIVTQLLSGRVPAVAVPEAAPWAAPLVDVVMRALSADPDKRFPSAAAMAAELRRIGALKVPLALRVAAVVRGSFGDAAKARREELERGEIRAKTPPLGGLKPESEELAIEVTDEADEALAEPSQTASTVPPPMLPEPGPAPNPLRSPTVESTQAIVAVAAPPAPVPVASPRAPLRVAPPPALVPVAPPPALVPVAPPPAPVPVAPAPPPARLPVPSTITTAAPFAVATPARPEPLELRATRPNGLLRIAVVGGAVLAIGAATWWIASRGSSGHSTAVVVAPSAARQLAAAPLESTTESPAAQATAPAIESNPASEPASANPPAPPLAPEPELPPVRPPPLGRTPAATPTTALPARPKHVLTRRAYDPQGI